MTTTPKFSGSTLVDENGTEVGEVKDVIYDSSETEPEWLVVKAGRLRGERREQRQSDILESWPYARHAC